MCTFGASPWKKTQNHLIWLLRPTEYLRLPKNCSFIQILELPVFHPKAKFKGFWKFFAWYGREGTYTCSLEKYSWNVKIVTRCSLFNIWNLFFSGEASLNMDDDLDLTSLNWLLTSNVMPSGIATAPIEASSSLPMSADELPTSLKNKSKHHGGAIGSKNTDSKTTHSLWVNKFVFKKRNTTTIIYFPLILGDIKMSFFTYYFFPFLGTSNPRILPQAILQKSLRFHTPAVILQLWLLTWIQQTKRNFW